MARPNTFDLGTSACVVAQSSGCKVTFNSTGYFYCTATYVANAGANAATYTVTKGHFVSRGNKYMFYQKGAAVTAYASSAKAGNRNFGYMNNYNSVASIKIPGCYYYTKGI